MDDELGQADVRVFVSRTGWQTWLDRREIVAVEEGLEAKPGRSVVAVTYRSGARFELLAPVDEFVAWWRGDR